MPIQEGERASERPAAKAKSRIRISFQCRKEDGSILKCKNQRTNLATRCQSSLLICFDTRKLVENKMPEFLMIELLRNTRKTIKGFKILVKRSKTTFGVGSALVSGAVDRRSVKRWWTKEKGFNTVWNQIVQENSCNFEPFTSLFWKCSNRSCVARQSTTAKGFYQVRLSRRTRKWTEINGA